MILPTKNPTKCHEEVLPLQPMFPPKRFGSFSPVSGICSEGLDAFSLFLKKMQLKNVSDLSIDKVHC